MLGFYFVHSVVMKKKYIFKEEEPIEISKIHDLINDIEEYQKYIIMTVENISQEFRLKNIGEIRNFLAEEIMQINLVSKKHKKVFQF